MSTKFVLFLLFVLLTPISYYYGCKTLYPQDHYNGYFVQYGPRWFHTIPETYRTESMYEIFMRNNNIYYLDYYDENKISQDMCNRIFTIKNDLQNLPEKCRLPEMYETYMYNNNINNLNTYNQSKITQEMCDRVVELRYSNIQNIPERFRTFKMCNKLVNFHPNFLLYVPRHIQTSEMCVNAISKNFNMIKYVKIEYDKTIKDIIRKKIIENHSYVEYIPKHRNNEDLFWFAFELSNGRMNMLYTTTNFTNRMRDYCLDKVNNDLTKLNLNDGCYKILEYMLP